MTSKHLSVLVKEYDLNKFKIIYDLIKKKHDADQITPPKYGRLGKDYLISFKFSGSDFESVVHSLTYNDITILLPDEQTKQVIEKLKRKYSVDDFNNNVIIDNSNINRRISVETVNTLIETGNYQAVIHLSKEINLEKEVTKKAINNINSAVNRAIDIAVSEAKNDFSEIRKNIKRLLTIASDQKIKSLNKIDLLKRAGMEAIELCAGDRDYYKILIDISNNNQIHNLINIKAAVRFAEIVLPLNEKFPNEISYAMKRVNIRWLQIALDVVQNSLTESDTKSLDSLFNFIKNYRR